MKRKQSALVLTPLLLVTTALWFSAYASANQQLALTNGTKLPVKIGLMIPFNASSMKRTIAFVTTASAVTIALDQIEKEQLLPAVEWSIVWHYPDCEESLAAGIASQLYLEEKVDVIIGPPCSIAAVVAGILGKFYNVPLISWAATDSQLSDEKRFPTFARTIGSSKELGEGLLEILRYFGWKEVAILFNDDKFRRKCHYVSTEFTSAVFRSKQFSVQIKLKQEIICTLTQNDDIDSFLKDVEKKARIVIVCLDHAEDRRRFMLRVHKMGMNTDEYVYILPDFITDTTATQLWEHPSGNDDDSNNDEARIAFENAITVEMELVDTPAVDAFRKLIPKKMKEWPYNYTTKQDEQYGSIYSPFMYDAVYMYAKALNRTLSKALDMDPNANLLVEKRNGRKIREHCKHITFDGMSGKVVTDENASRLPTFVLRAFTGRRQYEAVATLEMFRAKGKRMKMKVGESQLWGLRAGVKPRYRPLCGWEGELCDSKRGTVLPMAAGFAAIMLAIILFVIIRNRSNANNLEKLLWKIGKEELVKITKNSKDLVVLKSNVRSHAFCLYKGTVVAVKHHSVCHSFRSSEDQAEVRAMRTLSNENVNEFLGLCLDSPTDWSVWRVCWRGSLQDMFKKNSLELDWYFKISLIRDVINGLDYLFHSVLTVHGFMTSRNCLVDDRWRLKLSEYGLTFIKARTNCESDALFWTAPEQFQIDTGGNGLPTATQQSDIYSLGIVLSEILTQKCAYSNEDITAEEVVYKVQKGEIPPFRPTHSEDEYGLTAENVHTPVMLRLMSNCWEERPALRPDMKTIKAQLKLVTKDRELNLMDHVLSMMERYAGNLEAQIEDRTQELMEEKKKSDILLHRMLPKAVADQLKTSGKVNPEYYDSVTILFSDVVGFTVIAANSTPMQVVTLLNDLYSLFDGIIDRYDAYKVETIGDSYLVVSGLPQRNGDRHAVEMADLGLDMTEAIGTFRVAHKPNNRFQLRVGIHSGPCVAGVVGLSMPRYCLFGDAVNIASRMESHGKPGRVQITASTHKYLRAVGGYQMESRGEVMVKGKGVMTTHWLLSNDGNMSSKFLDHIPLPSTPNHEIAETSNPVNDVRLLA